MRYLNGFLEKNAGTPRTSAYETYETPDSTPREIRNTPREVPAKPTKPTEPASDQSRPLWPPRAAELAGWPAEWRERWGRRANALEAEGVAFPDSERRAFEEIEAELAVSSPPESSTGRHRGPRDVRLGDSWLPWHGRGSSLDDLRGDTEQVYS